MRERTNACGIRGGIIGFVLAPDLGKKPRCPFLVVSSPTALGPNLLEADPQSSDPFRAPTIWNATMLLSHSSEMLFDRSDALG